MINRIIPYGLSALMLLTPAIGCKDTPRQTTPKPTIESKVEPANPLQDTETYEIPAGKYTIRVDTDRVCYVPFKTIEYGEARIFFKRLNPQNSFKKPLETDRDDMIFLYSLPYGDYEIWVGNQGNYTRVDSLIVPEDLKKELEQEKYKKIRIYAPSKDQEQQFQESIPEAPQPPFEPGSELPSAPGPSPGLPAAPMPDPA